MKFPVFSAGEEPSARTGFSGNRIDRQSEHRPDDAAEKALDDPAARILLARGGRLFLELGADGVLAGWHDTATANALGARFDQAVLLGRLDGRPLLAAPSSADVEGLPEGIKAIDYRSVYVQGLLNREDEGALAQGAALLAWHSNHRFCGRCGGPTQMRAGGYKRVCSQCEAELFPRTDPVTIMLTVSGDRCLMGRSPHFTPAMYSCLAGFVEPGETIEDAVRRETLEESGIRVGRVAYHASQPWPFPYSLMIGCYGEALSEDIHADLTELEDCRWFTRAEVREMLARPYDGELPSVPPKGAIATRLIADWVAAG